MVLDVKKYKLGTVELNKNEQKLLLLLSDNNCHTSAEIMRYLQLYSRVSISKIMRGINEKMKEKVIINCFGIGYKTLLQIEITY